MASKKKKSSAEGGSRSYIGSAIGRRANRVEWVQRMFCLRFSTAVKVLSLYERPEMLDAGMARNCPFGSFQRTLRAARIVSPRHLADLESTDVH